VSDSVARFLRCIVLICYATESPCSRSDGLVLQLPSRSRLTQERHQVTENSLIELRCVSSIVSEDAPVKLTFCLLSDHFVFTGRPESTPYTFASPRWNQSIELIIQYSSSCLICPVASNSGAIHFSDRTDHPNGYHERQRRKQGLILPS
jgi:hypothetical protein